MRTTIKTLYALAAMATLVSCNKKRSRNYQYFPNMYESVGYEAYSSHEGNVAFEDNHTSEALKPVEGTVNRGWLPYDYENSNEGYQAAKAGLKNPLPYTKENVENGKVLYDIYCAICHGGKGNGKGQLVKNEKILGVPSYDDQGRAITEGSIYHVMYYGINSMGSYAAQTSIEERWQIVQYVQSLKASLEGNSPRLDQGKFASNKEYLFGNGKVTRLTSVEAIAPSIEGTELDAHSVVIDHEEHHNVEAHKEPTTKGKNPLLNGKSHHSHKEAGKK